MNTKSKDCRECKYCDEIIGDYLLQCTEPSTRSFYNNKWGGNSVVHLQSADDDDMPCGPVKVMFTPLRGIIARAKRARVLKSEKDFWARTQERYGGPLGKPLDGPLGDQP